MYEWALVVVLIIAIVGGVTIVVNGEAKKRIKPCPFCGEGVMGNKYPCWEYTIHHKPGCFMRNYAPKTYIYPEVRDRWNKRR